MFIVLPPVAYPNPYQTSEGWIAQRRWEKGEARGGVHGERLPKSARATARNGTIKKIDMAK